MAVITLTTDHGKLDHYTGSVKGALLCSGVSDLKIVDISHSIRPFDVFEAAFVLKECYTYFPEGTVHLVSINDHVSESQVHLVMKLKDQFFIGADNGIFPMVAGDDGTAEYFMIDSSISKEALVFPLRERLVPAACHIARGGMPELLGQRVTEVLKAEMYKPLLDPNVIRGQVLYVDGYENAVTNISHQTFRDIGKGRSFRIHLVKSRENITKISSSYSDTAPGRALAVFGTSGLLEIAISKAAPRMGGGAKSLLGLKTNDIVRIEFE